MTILDEGDEEIVVFMANTFSIIDDGGPAEVFAYTYTKVDATTGQITYADLEDGVQIKQFRFGSSNTGTIFESENGAFEEDGTFIISN